MNALGSSRPIAMRRYEVERHIAAQRVSIAVAWMDFADAEGRVELNLRRAIGWARRASSAAISVAAFCTLRRMFRAAPAGAAGILSKAATAVATWRSLRRLANR
jgi:hypothetical protein